MAKRAKTAGKFKIKRVYEPATEDDGLRVLVDRLWPRGIAKQKAHIDQWLKDVAPSHELRRRFHDKSAEWKEFVAAYGRELKQDPARGAAAALREQLRHGAVTLLYASRNETYNNAAALKDWLEQTGRA